ncbi:putative toxin-antitoxin system toxin component, PIN family [Halorussus vallis]|uniref:putative toxin-antitoxin system toxin component, PIN family n=1 Tax=Halorussus vallis TaxID=2953749 RepID=UPI00209F8791|nr:putative toxin-antitoxin system toxin component, PIN family [Halorussus vallis]USZ75363.1 putative toxin-antitoxin system toxin component, PIN family [Halorussus vallis]
MARPIVVFDTNVLVAELAFPDERERCFALAEDGAVELVVSPALLREFAAVLDYDRLPLPAGRREAAVERVARFARIVEPVVDLDVAADPDDDAVLEAALAGAADLAVSDDAHLREVDGVLGIEVAPREAFLERFARSAAHRAADAPGGAGGSADEPGESNRDRNPEGRPDPDDTR